MIERSHHDIMEKIDQTELTRLTQDLVRLPSVSGNEQNVAMFIADTMKSWGLEVSIDQVVSKRPNVYGILRGRTGKKTLMYNGHTDVVPPGEGWSVEPFGGLLREERIFGRGSADMKGPLASMMIAAKALKESRVKLDGTLLIAAVIGEEDDQIGTLHLLDKKIEANFAVVGEPSELQLCIAHKGDASYEITVEGRSAHSSVPHEGINAIYKMSKIINAIEKYSTKLEQGDRNPLLGTATLNVGTIAGGITPWNVPASCKIVVDRRLLPHETAEMAMKQFQEVLEGLKAEDPELIARVRIGVVSLSLETSPDESIVRTFRQAIEAVTGKDPGIKGVPYTTDGGILSKKGKMPTIIFGPGDIKQAHRPDESIPIGELMTGAKVYALAAANILS